MRIGWQILVAVVAVLVAAPAPGDETRPLIPRGGVGASPTESSEPASGPGDITRQAAGTILPLLGVLAVIGGVYVGFRSIARQSGGLRSMLGAGGRAPAGVLEVLGRYPVGRGQTLVLLKLDRRVLLVSQTGGGRLGGAGMRTLCEVDDPDDVASLLTKTRDESSESMSSRFQQMLRGFEGRHERAEQKFDPTRETTRIRPQSMPPAQVPQASSRPMTIKTQTGADAAAALRARLQSLRAAEIAGGGA